MSFWEPGRAEIHNWRTWPIGEKIIFSYSSFAAIGFIIAKSRKEITVLWSGNAFDTLKTYNVVHLNEITIMRFADYEIKRKTGKF